MVASVWRKFSFENNGLSTAVRRSVSFILLDVAVSCLERDLVGVSPRRLLTIFQPLLLVGVSLSDDAHEVHF